MEIRQSEKPHAFNNQLHRAIPLHDLQGLTLDSQNNFTAGMEAVEYDRDEDFKIADLFTPFEWNSKWHLCSALSIPLYLTIHQKGACFLTVYRIVKVSLATDKLTIRKHAELSFSQYANFWAKLKGTVQTKPLLEASERVGFFDDLLAKYRLAWGGNVDGFLLDAFQIKPQAIIENRVSTKKPLYHYDPADYFTYRGGDYKSWEALVLLAMKLKIPLFLFTFERNSLEKQIGFSIVDSISQQDLSYRNGAPYSNITQGISNITNLLQENLSEAAPYLR